MKKMIKTPLALAMGTGLLSALSVTTAQATAFETDSNLFEITELSNPYSQAANQEEGKCGQGKCGQGTCGTQTPPPQ